MKRRCISLILAVVIFVSLMPFDASGTQIMTTSSDAVAILKAEEGFSKTPYWDYAQWTVGYGTKCPDDMLGYYKQYGITEAEAESLLCTYLQQFESEIIGFMSRTGVTLNQNQFDALVLFSYNCGSGWSYQTGGVFYNAIAGGATGNDLIYAFCRWCSAGGQVQTYLLRRRLCEANMYLNGVYSQTPPGNYGYVIYDGCGGKASPNVQGFDTDLTAKIISTASYEDYTFDGWYTAASGGTKVTVLDAAVKNKRLYAHWTDSDGNSTTAEEPEGITVTVSVNGVNVRKGPGTNYSVVGSVNTGDQMVITETAEGSGYTWGKFTTGWICLKYTNYDTVSEEKEQKPDTKTRSGTVRVTGQDLNVRSGPSTGYKIVGHLSDGTRVEILEQQIAGSMVWGKIDIGWISLNYVELDPEEEKKPEEKPQKPENAEDDTLEAPGGETQRPDAPAPVTGTVMVSGQDLRIRSGPSTSTAILGYLSNGTKVEILEQTTSGTMTWGKIDKGWISLDYVVLDKTQDSPSPKVTGKVKVNDFLRVRSGPGTSYAIAGYLSNAESVEILERKTVGSTEWGKIDKGWISLDYVELDKAGVSAPQKTTGRIKVNDVLRIRSGPGTSYAIAGYLSNGTAVEILERKSMGNTEWGKIDKGWISLAYVVLDVQSSKPETVTKTVSASCLRVRSGAGTGYSIVGYLYSGAKVEILETRSVNGTQWGKTAKGWISMDYVK